MHINDPITATWKRFEVLWCALNPRIETCVINILHKSNGDLISMCDKISKSIPLCDIVVKGTTLNVLHNWSLIQVERRFQHLSYACTLT